MITRPRVRHFENHIERTMFLKKRTEMVEKVYEKPI
jgi:hypothetical protein